MKKDDFTKQMSKLLKLIRTEYALTQEEMAVVMGISKKTLVETEKGRRRLGWTESVALAALFSQSQVLQNHYGGEIEDMLQAIAFQDMEIRYPSTMSGKMWWRTVEESGGFRIQQNVISHHYRLLNGQDQRIISSFDKDEVRAALRDELRAAEEEDLDE